VATGTEGGTEGSS